MTLSNSDVISLVERYEKEVKSFKEEALKMSWFMRGGISYDDAIMLSQVEREIVTKLIKENMETTKKSGLPFF